MTMKKLGNICIHTWDIDWANTISETTPTSKIIFALNAQCPVNVTY